MSNERKLRDSRLGLIEAQAASCVVVVVVLLLFACSTRSMNPQSEVIDFGHSLSCWHFQIPSRVCSPSVCFSLLAGCHQNVISVLRSPATICWIRLKRCLLLLPFTCQPASQPSSRKSTDCSSRHLADDFRLESPLAYCNHQAAELFE